MAVKQEEIYTYEGEFGGFNRRVIIEAEFGQLKHKKVESYIELEDIDGRKYWQSSHVDCSLLLVLISRRTLKIV